MESNQNEIIQSLKSLNDSHDKMIKSLSFVSFSEIKQTYGKKKIRKINTKSNVSHFDNSFGSIKTLANRYNNENKNSLKRKTIKSQSSNDVYNLTIEVKFLFKIFAKILKLNFLIRAIERVKPSLYIRNV